MAAVDKSLKSICEDFAKESPRRKRLLMRNLEMGCSVITTIASAYNFNDSNYSSGMMFGILAFGGAILAYDSHLAYREKK